MIIVFVSLAIVGVFFGNKVGEKTYRIILLAFWFVLVISEVLYQIVFPVWQNGGVTPAPYSWIAFPFQFCSMPLYTLPFVALLPDGKVRNAFSAFVSSFVIFAGIVVCIIPDGLLRDNAFLNIQAFFQHGFPFAIGVFIASRNRDKASISQYLSGTIVFFVAISLAIIMNEIGHSLNLQYFNMFHISPHQGCPLPVLNTIQPLVDPTVFIIIYAFGFAAVGFIVYQLFALPLSKFQSIRWKRN
ncbi:MAG: YwaF family protein [Clostridia bacterium]|nr:YwaF family protein [Clostridia bacterium]